MDTGYLILQDGTIFPGHRFGADSDVCATVVFSTSMVGVHPTLSDPANQGLMVVETFPIIGGYGYIEDEMWAKPCLAAYIVREIVETPSNFRCEMPLSRALQRAGIPGLSGVDTRALTRHLRDHGEMTGVIVSTLDYFEPPLTISNVKHTTCQEAYTLGTGAKTLAVLDLGLSKPLVELLLSTDCTLHVYPASTDAGTLLSQNPAALFVSDGPGNPDHYATIIDTLQKVHIPTFAMGLSHLLLAIAHGGTAKAMQRGHRGVNIPVIGQGGFPNAITRQNHGFVVDQMPPDAVLTHENLNDHTVEGLAYPTINSRSVAFMPTQKDLSTWLGGVR